MTVDDLMKIGRAARTAYIMQRQGVAGTLPDAERAATVAIVRALRDEFVMMGMRDFSSDFDIKKSRAWFNEILGDAGEKVAEGNFTNPSEGRVIAPATDPIRDAVAMARGRALVVDDIPMLNKLAAMMKPATDACPHCKGEGCTPHLDRKGNVYPEPCQHCETTGRVKATDAAPAVCVWRFNLERSVWRTHCGQYYGSFQAGDREPMKHCYHCSAPIKFTEANHG